jgi:hypothetical protein
MTKELIPHRMVNGAAIVFLPMRNDQLHLRSREPIRIEARQKDHSANAEVPFPRHGDAVPQPDCLAHGEQQNHMVARDIQGMSKDRAVGWGIKRDVGKHRENGTLPLEKINTGRDLSPRAAMQRQKMIDVSATPATFQPNADTIIEVVDKIFGDPLGEWPGRVIGHGVSDRV